MKPRIAIINFPGTNCEQESKVACEAVGMKAEIIRWNEQKDLNVFDGFILPGGWSYEDRIRSGVIASKDPIMQKLKEQAAKGKAILGICNGCQILIESGLVGDGKIALAPNVNPLVSGYYSTWVTIKAATAKKNAFTSFLPKGEVIPIPIAHGEGRFVSSDYSVLGEMEDDGQIAFVYSDAQGNVSPEFPVNPNGSTLNIAGILNEKGNVLALMPHPERGFFRFQLKEKEMKTFEDAMSITKAAKIFESMREYCA